MTIHKFTLTGSQTILISERKKIKPGDLIFHKHESHLGLVLFYTELDLLKILTKKNRIRTVQLKYIGPKWMYISTKHFDRIISG